MAPRVRTARRPDPEQKKLIKAAGLDPEKWLVTHDNASYLYLVDRGMEQRDFVIIDKATGERCDCQDEKERRDKLYADILQEEKNGQMAICGSGRNLCHIQ